MTEYAVYLVHDGEHGGKQHITSPVTGSRLDFYESGVWLTRAEGRNFFPYDQIRTIREHDESTHRSRESESGVHSEESGVHSEESADSDSEPSSSSESETHE